MIQLFTSSLIGFVLALSLAGCATDRVADSCDAETESAYLDSRFTEEDQSPASLELHRDDFEHEHMCVLEET